MKRIIKILNVCDTRDWEEVAEDKWVAIPGSGDPHVCDRCGRMHEVHAEVLCDDNTKMVVGTGCAKGEMADPIFKALKSSVSTLKTLKKLQAQLDSLKIKRHHREEVIKLVQDMPKPEITFKEEDYGYYEDKCPMAVMGDAYVWLKLTNGKLTEERRTSLELSWEQNRERDLGCTKSLYSINAEIEYIENRIRKAENKLEQLRLFN